MATFRFNHDIYTYVAKFYVRDTDNRIFCYFSSRVEKGDTICCLCECFKATVDHFRRDLTPVRMEIFAIPHDAEPNTKIQVRVYNPFNYRLLSVL